MLSLFFMTNSSNSYLHISELTFPCRTTVCWSSFRMRPPLLFLHNIWWGAGMLLGRFCPLSGNLRVMQCKLKFWVTWNLHSDICGLCMGPLRLWPQRLRSSARRLHGRRYCRLWQRLFFFGRAERGFLKPRPDHRFSDFFVPTWVETLFLLPHCLHLNWDKTR